MITGAGARREFRRTPIASSTLACELCEFSTDSHGEFQQHLKAGSRDVLSRVIRCRAITKHSYGLSQDQHLPGRECDAHRAEEEYRKRMCFYEQTQGRKVFQWPPFTLALNLSNTVLRRTENGCGACSWLGRNPKRDKGSEPCSFQGPFAVGGEQLRRGLGAHAWHQTHSIHGTRMEPRRLRSCDVCARSLWPEDMRRLRLFVTASTAGKDTVAEAAFEIDNDKDELHANLEAGSGLSPEADGLDAEQVQHVHDNIFDVRRYERTWPLIPAAELRGSCVSHPTGQYSDGTPWLWLLNRKAFPQDVSPEAPCWVCEECSSSLTRKRPCVPKYALANNLWIGRLPAVFRSGKKRLSAMTFTLLSLGRAVVRKIIAERQKPRRPEEKQKGMRANTVAFPQAKIRELVTAHLPPTSEEATRYLADCISIVLVGVDPEAVSYTHLRAHET